MALAAQLVKCMGCNRLHRIPRAVPAAQTASTCCSKPMKKLCNLKGDDRG